MPLGLAAGRGAIPCALAKGLLPGRGAPGRCMPCALAKGLLPGRGAPGRGMLEPPSGTVAGADGVAVAAAVAAAGTAEAAAAGAEAEAAAAAAVAEEVEEEADAVGVDDAGTADGDVADAGTTAAGAGVGVATNGAGAAGRGPRGVAPAAVALGAAAAESTGDFTGATMPWAASAARSLRATGGSMLDDGPLTNSPISFKISIAFLLSMPNSLAISCRRGLATILLSGPPPRPERRH